jgi:FixJ family two-component response regulator
MLAKETAPTVYIVDDDAEVLKAMGRLVASANLNVAAFSSAQSFLAAFDPRRLHARSRSCNAGCKWP